MKRRPKIMLEDESLGVSVLTAVRLVLAFASITLSVKSIRSPSVPKSWIFSWYIPGFRVLFQDTSIVSSSPLRRTGVFFSRVARDLSSCERRNLRKP